MTREEKAQSLGQLCFPDEINIWARPNYEAQWVSEACIKMADWEHKRLVDKACEWLENINTDDYMDSCIFQMYDMIQDFRKAMEE